VDAAHGGRIVEVSLGGTNVLMTSQVEGFSFGSTFWTSPQSDWGWPPVAALDGADYASSIQGARLVVTSADFSVEGRTLVVEKAFEVRAPSRALRVEYTIRNEGADPIDLAPWEITRVPTGGLTFFPNPIAGVMHYPSADWTPVPTRIEDGYTFFPYDEAQIPADRKLFADGGEKGYVAHARGDLLLVKSWNDVSSSGRAPNEGEIELYANGAHTFVEVEDQGRYAALPAQRSVTFVVAWSLLRLPKSIGDAAAAANDPTTRAMLESAADAAAAAAPR
jgi:hypothetical protein